MSNFLEVWTLSLAVLLLLGSVIDAFLVPAPAGKYNVSLTTGPLSDYTRQDPDPTTSGPRTLMLSVFEPTTCLSTTPVPYIANKTANFQGPFLQQILNTTLNVTPLFREAQLPVCPPYHTSNCTHAQEFPVLLFSPGYSIPRAYYNFLASAIASEGFIVISIDHPGDANIITYPDGHTSINNDTVQGPTNIMARIPSVVADVSFLVDQLSNATAVAGLLPHRGLKPFPTDRIAMLGHSLGGITAVLAAEQDARLKGVINWDGNLLELPTSCGVSQPTLLISAELLFPTWEAAWPLLNGPRLWISVANATHFSFSDGPTLFRATGQDITPYADLLGAIAPTEMVKILVGYAVSWMQGVFAGEDEGAWRAVQDLEFSEVSVVRVEAL